eukprot:scaffold21888_cov177-Skeletonema_marinoi.AAC.2
MDSASRVAAVYLNNALAHDGLPPTEWKHDKIEVPKQTDSCSCGLLRTVNGIVLTLPDDQAAVKDILVSQATIVKFIRRKLTANLLLINRVTRDPDDLLRHFKCARDKTEEEKKFEEEKKNSRKTTTNEVVLDAALRKILHSQTPIVVPPNVEKKCREELLGAQGHLFRTLLHQSPDNFIERCFDDEHDNTSQQQRDQVQECKDAFHKFLLQYNSHCVQVLCLKSLSAEIWCKFEATNEAFLLVFAEYFAETLAHIARATLILDNGKAIVEKDIGKTLHCTDWLRDQSQNQNFVMKYSFIKMDRVLKPPEDDALWYETLLGWTHEMYDTITNIRDAYDNVLRNMPKGMSAVRRNDRIVVSYTTSTGMQQTVERCISYVPRTSKEYKSSKSSFPLDLDYFAYRFYQLKKLYLKCIHAKVPVPEGLWKELVRMHYTVATKKRRHIACDDNDEDDDVDGKAKVISLMDDNDDDDDSDETTKDFLRPLRARRNLSIVETAVALLQTSPVLPPTLNLPPTLHLFKLPSVNSAPQPALSSM